MSKSRFTSMALAGAFAVGLGIAFSGIAQAQNGGGGGGGAGGGSGGDGNAGFVVDGISAVSNQNGRGRGPALAPAATEMACHYNVHGIAYRCERVGRR
ncbi:hypothetical protein [Phreatobacter stygius]|uniref:Uncharacterized protein n=1 Tax=Phreatobacter stygius TaxID=1940610 RepID=A0A4D7BDP7_9HYPH|nr:hypothetical protein [Phreatobacter stygius]QCI66112.1 hypothetical protein E8M01_19000 [Phreatobacter stygius]